MSIMEYLHMGLNLLVANAEVMVRMGCCLNTKIRGVEGSGRLLDGRTEAM